MKAWKVVVSAVGVLGFLTTLTLGNKAVNGSASGAGEVVSKPVEMFAGVPLSDLDRLAKEVYHGLSCSIDKWGFLIFNWKSNRGHQTFHTQMMIDEAGKLVNLGGQYPGQTWSTADEFARRANELFHFGAE